MLYCCMIARHTSYLYKHKNWAHVTCDKQVIPWRSWRTVFVRARDIPGSYVPGITYRYLVFMVTTPPMALALATRNIALQAYLSADGV